MPKKKETRGGARPVLPNHKPRGRKPHDKISISATVAKEVAERLAQEPNKSAAVEWALREYFSLPGWNSNI